MAMSARELLANLPLQLAKGGSANKKQLLAAEKKYLANPDKRTGAQLYNMMLEQGVDVNDLLNAGVKQSTIDQVFTAQGPVPMKQFTAPTTAKSSLAGLEAQERERAIARGTSLVNKLQQGGVDAEERRRLQRAATQYGVTFEDMIRAGIDPSILFDVQLKQTPKGPQETTGTTGTTGTVYTPGAVDPRGPGIDQAFRDSPVRERIPGTDEFDPMTGSPTGYRYTPAARLTPATGSGLSWTPPVVTSRPRQLLDVGGGYQQSYSQRYAKGRTEQDRALMEAFEKSGRPYNYAEYTYWRNRLRANDFGGLQDVPLNKEGFNAAFNTWNESTSAPSSSAMTSSDQNTVAGTNQSPYNFYSNDYGPLPSYLSGTNAELAGQDPTASFSRMPSATPITVGGARMFNDGGFVKKPEGVVEESATPETESAQMLNRITAGSSPTADYPLTEEGTVDWSQRQSPASQFLSWLTTGGERQARYLTENQNKSPIWDVPATIVKDDKREQAKAMLRGLQEIPGTVANYATETIQGDEPLKTFSQDVGTVGRAMYEGAKEDPIGFALDMTPGIGQYRAVKDASNMAQMAIEAEAAGDFDAAKMYREMSALSMSGVIPVIPGKSASKVAKFTFKPGNVTRVRELPETDIPQLEVDFKRHQSDIGSPEQLIQLANTVNPEFQNLLTNIATEVGVDYKAGPVKKLNSISDKLVRKDMGPEEIADSIRGTMLVNTNEQAEQIISSLSKSQAIIDEGWKRLPGNGYFDRKVSIQYVGPNGEKVLGELQLMTPDMLRAKDKPGGGHDLYAIERNYEKLYGRENIEQKMPPSEVMAYRQVKEDQLKTYNQVADRADPAIQREMGYQPVSDSARMLSEIDKKADGQGSIDAISSPLRAAKMLDEFDVADASPLLSKAEATNINKSVGRNKDKQEIAQQTALDFKQKFSPTKGWAPTEINGIKVKKSGIEVLPKKIPYGFHKPPAGVDEASWANSISDGIVGEVNQVVDRAVAGDQAALNIIKEANWYRTMRDRLRAEFGSMGDVFADVLGATSAQTNVEQNFNNAIEIMRKYSRGDYDGELQALTRRIEAGESISPTLLTQLHKSGEFPLITKDSGALFNANSPAAMGALLNMFRTIGAGKAPKTPNFTGNLIGLTDEATVDVWAARMLRRVSGKDRIPPAAESAVAGSHLVGSTLMEPKIGSEFGFGQKVFRDAATRINNEGRLQQAFPEVGNVGPDDLQAVAWFIEKENWTKNGWTTKAGEGGSLDYEMSLAGAPDQARVSELRRDINKGFKTPNRRKNESDADYAARVQVASDKFDLDRDTMQAELSIMEAPLQRYQIGISGERPDRPMSNYAQAELAAELDDVVRSDPTVSTYNIANTYGSLTGDTKRALNAEFVVRQDFNPQNLRQRVIEQGKAYDQDAVFLSKVVPPGTVGARPGVEIYFKESITPQQMAKATARLREYGVDGFTYATDMRFDDRIAGQARSGDPETAALTGLRFQYVPEFDDTFNPAKAAEKYTEMEDLFEDIVDDIILEGNVSDARVTHYDTEVIFRDQYDDLLRETTRKNDTEKGQGLSNNTVSAEADSGRKGTGQELSEPVPDRSGKRSKVTYEQFGGSLGDAKQKLGITEEQFKSFKDANKGIKQKRVPEVQEAAKKLKNGEITTQEYNKVVEEKMPIVPIGKVPKRPTVEEIAMSLSTKKDATAGGIVGVNIDVPDGTMISSRLDIPAYESYDTWVVTLHDGTLRNGNAVAYGPTAVLDNVTFTLNGTAEGPLRMATGEINKGTVARINGAWKNMDPTEVEQMAKSILDGTAPDASDWVEVGMNPFRHSYFYRKADGMPVADAEQVIQVGPLVLAKKAKTRPIESPEHLIDPGPPPKYFKRGGNVERVYNERRYI